MSNARARRIMAEFTRAHIGTTVYFAELTEAEKEAFIIADSFRFFSNFSGIRKALKSAVKNAEAYKRGVYDLPANARLNFEEG